MTNSALADQLPPSLMVAGKPIDPLCFEEIGSEDWHETSNCAGKDIIKSDEMQSDFFSSKIGYYYRMKDDAPDAAASYSFYEYIGEWNKTPVVVTYTSGGGSGQFTSLISIEREGDKIRVKQGFAAGDRCNGGVVDVTLKNGSLYYGQWISPFDFLQIADDNPNDLQPYEHLEASAASCFGIARYADGELTGVTLEAAATDEDGEKAIKYQPCFNMLYRSYLEQEKVDLTVAQLKEFTAEFNQVCLEKL